MTTQIQILVSTFHHDTFVNEVNDYLRHLELEGHTVKDIKFQNNDGSEKSEASTSVMIIFELYEPSYENLKEERKR